MNLGLLTKPFQATRTRAVKTMALLGLLVLPAVGLSPSRASADIWTYDLSFGFLGRSLLDVGELSDSYANDVIKLSNGDLLAVGSAKSKSNSGTGRSLALARYKPNGFPNPSFGSGGQVTTVVLSAEADAQANAVTELPNGDLVVVGQVFNGNSERIVVARYNSDGSLDTDFDGNVDSNNDGVTDGNGVVTHQPSNSGYSRLEDVIPGPNGEILAAGTVKDSGAERSALIRYQSNGKPNLTFDGDSGNADGVVLVDFTEGQTSYYGYGQSITAMQNGKVALAGYAVKPNSKETQFAVSVHSTSDGVLDGNFSGDGFAVTQVGDGKNATGESIVEINGNLYVGGTVLDAGIFRAGFASYKTSGELNTNFDGDGRTIVSAGSTGIFTLKQIVTFDGDIVGAGLAVDNGQAKTAIVRVKSSNGSVDSSFGENGTALLQFFADNPSQSSGANSITENGQLITASGVITNGTRSFALMRYGLNPAPPSPPPPVTSQVTQTADKKAPNAKITKPKATSARKLKKLTGTATDTTSNVTKVEINLVRKSGSKCYAYKGGKLRKLSCKTANSTWTRATLSGKKKTTTWSLPLKLKSGSYTVRARAVDAAGNVQKTFTASAGSMIKFKLKR